MQINKRSNFLAIKEKYAKLKEKPRLTESSLFLVQPMVDTKSVYTFDPLENSNQLPEELRLNINDEFIAVAFGVYLYGKVADAAAASSTSQLLTHMPYEQLAVTESLKAGNLFAGALSISVNNIKYVEKLDLRRNNMAGEAALTIYGNTSFDFHKDGMIELQPMVTLSGAKRNEITISLPDSLKAFSFNVIGTTQTMTYTIDKIAIRMFGLNGMNAAKFQS
jgi:hypothetical protein